MTKADLIKWLQEDELPGNTPVYIPNDPTGREYTQVEDTGHEQIGTVENPQKLLYFTPGGDPMTRRRWILLKRYENRWPVWRYEPLQRYDLKARIRDGWKEIKKA